MTAPVVVVQADDAVVRIAAVLDQHRISAVPVVDSDGGVVGPGWSVSMTCSPNRPVPPHARS
ncbi:hypothetical protein Rwratislav_27859 [Rhodococcus wratislaviensis IFP 2016]|nr:hypothetical protein Rwratislav_27859 [Rhodococcus wratislaviensis IFP 2016]